MSSFEFLRPVALWLLLLLPLLHLALRRQGLGESPWHSHFDPALLRELTAGGPVTGSRRAGHWLALLAFGIAVLALAGPSWRMVEVPTQPPRAEAVIVLGLAPSMMAEDLSPNRLTRARIALGEWLDQNPEQLTGLVTFAASAYRVSPLTQDRETMKHLLGSLQPDVLPRAGADIAAGLRLGQTLFSSAPGPKHLLLVTDAEPTQASFKLAKGLANTGIGLRVLSVGTEEGAPIPLSNGRFATTSAGRLQMARVDHGRHRELAQAAGGAWQRALRFDAARWVSTDMSGLQATAEAGSRGTRLPQDDGAWLLLLLVPLAATLFRRGALLGLLLLLTPLPTPVTAAALPDWLLNEEQRRVQAYRAQPDEETAKQLPPGEWRGYGAFEQGDFATAAEAFAGELSARAQYNHALSLAHQGQIDEAIAGFSALLEQQPDHEDARHNLEVLQRARDAQSEEQAGDSADSSQAEQDAQQQDSAAQDGQPQAGDSAQEESPASEPQRSESETAQDQQQNEQQEAGASQEPEEPADEKEPGDETEQAQADAQAASLTANEAEQADNEERAVLQWLNRVESDPGRLLRERFRSQDARRRRENN